MASVEGVAMDAMSISAVGAGAQPVSADALAIVSHDLKNPLSILSMVTSLLAESRRTEEDRAKLLQIAQRATQRMERLIGDLLDNARIEARRPLAVEPRAMDLTALIREVCEGFGVKAAREGKTIDFDVREELPAVHADGERLHQVLTNLVGNAMKFTPPGGRVRLLAERVGSEVRLSVTDSGPGIPEDQVGHLFEPFWQAPCTARLGTGLGLKIAKGIVEAHGGAIGVSSAADGGSTFFFTVPLAEGNGQAKGRGNGHGNGNALPSEGVAALG